MRAMTASRLGVVARETGRYDEAMAYFDQAISEPGSPPSLHGTILLNIGSVFQARGNYLNAVRRFEEGYAICRSAGSAHGQVTGLAFTSVAKRCLGEHEEAVELGRKALHIATEGNLTDLVGEAANALGEALVAYGDLDEAMRTFQHAVKSAEQLRLPRFLARGLNGIAHVMRARGDLAAARGYWLQALKVNPPEAAAWVDTAAHLERDAAGALCGSIDSVANTELNRQTGGRLRKIHRHPQVVKTKTPIDAEHRCVRPSD